MSRVPPPLPPDPSAPRSGSASPSTPPRPPGFTELPDQAAPVHPPVPPKQTPKSKLNRHLGDLSPEEIAALFPPEEEDEIEESGTAPPPIPSTGTTRSSHAMPPIQGASPPPSPSAPKEVISFVPPPVQGEKIEAEEESSTRGPIRPIGWAARRKMLLFCLGVSLAIGILIAVLLGVVLSPDRLHSGSGPEENASPTNGITQNQTAAPARRILNLNDTTDIDFIAPDDEHPE